MRYLICICLEKPEVEIYRKWICIICGTEMSGSMLGSRRVGSGAEIQVRMKPVPYTCME